jgi:hypothetical protein
MWFKGNQFQEHRIQLRLRKGIRIQAILGWIQTPDPGLGHFGPDFDTGSGPESAFTDSVPCAALTHSRTLVSVKNSDFLTIERNKSTE